MKHHTETVHLSSGERELIRYALQALECTYAVQADTKASCERLRKLIDNSDIDVHKAPEPTR